MNEKKEVICFVAPDWCATSRLMCPVFKEVSADSRIKNLKFTLLDVESQFGVDMSCKYQVRNVPTIIVVSRGRVIDRYKGFQEKEKLVKALGKWK